jgi:hypothetical protein
MTQKAFSLQAYARNSYNYYERMVDAAGLPYFNIFGSDPAEAAHDWPDFGDVMGRQYQATIMARVMTGDKVATEDVWRRNLFALLSPQDGLLYRPATNFSTNVADFGDQCLTLFAFATAQLANPSAEMERAVVKMMRGLEGRTDEILKAPMGFLLKSLTAVARAVPNCGALELAGRLSAALVKTPGIFPPDDHYPQNTHMHGTLRTLVGVADYARMTGDRALVERVHQLYCVFRAMGTSFGFIPEAVDRPGDIVTCETCALMDYAGLGVTLANAGYMDCWDDMERLTRNQLVESQAADLSWLKVDNSRPDTAQFSWHDLSARLVGSYAGWTSPTHFWGAEETLNHHWGGPELRDKPRLLQNCCGGSGVHAFFILWKNILRYADGCVTVNLHMDKRIPEAELLSDQPYRGHLELTLHRDAAVRFRLPDWLKQDAALRLSSKGASVPWSRAGAYMQVGQQPAGSRLVLDYPLPVWTEDVVVGNPGYRRYTYRATWKGDTVIKLEPTSEPVETGYSDFDGRQVPIHFGEAGPGRLYQREAFLSSEPPVHGPQHEDTVPALDLW